MGRGLNQEEMIEEIRRLKEACRKTESKYLKIDYSKRIKKLKKELSEYNFHRKETKT